MAMEHFLSKGPEVQRETSWPEIDFPMREFFQKDLSVENFGVAASFSYVG